MGDKSCPFSVEEARSLTVPKLKAELIRLNQPISGLKRKAHYVEALTVSFTLWFTDEDGARSELFISLFSVDAPLVFSDCLLQGPFGILTPQGHELTTFSFS